MTIRYEQWHDGEWLRVKHKGFREQCCDCGLIHVLDFRVIDGAVEVRSRRDDKATAAARARRKHKRK